MPASTQFAAARRKDKQITVQITELLARISITGLDREDIEAISRSLYRVPKTVEKFAARYLICAPHLGKVDFSRQIALVEQAVDIIALMIKELEESHFEAVNQANEKLQTIEGEADKLIPQLLTDLYSGQHPPLTIIMAKDLYELLEKVVDRCRDAGNIVNSVDLKNSKAVMEPVFLLLLVNLAVLVFTYTNGFHDAANAIATVVGTRVLSPR